MARWKLESQHYLNSPGNEWEYQEENRLTKKMVRKRFPVPRLFDPKDPNDWSQMINRDEGIVVVCWEGKGEPADHIFIGDPTPEMTPMDDEARQISEKLGTLWHNPMGADALPAQEGAWAGSAGAFSQSLLREFEKGIQDIVNRQGGSVPNVPLGGVDQKAFEALQQQVALLAEQNKLLLEQLQAKPVVDDLEPLEEITEVEEPVPAAPAATLERRI